MGFAGSKVFLGIVFFLMATTLILHTIGYVVHYWWYSDIEIMGVTGSAVGGLWFVCIYRDDQTFGICATYEQTSDLEGWFNAVRGLGLGGACVLFLAVMCCVSALGSSNGKMCRLGTAILCFLAFLVITAEWAVFVARIQKDGWISLDQWDSEAGLPQSSIIQMSVDTTSYSTSFLLTVIADGLCLLCGILATVSWRAKAKEVWPQ